MIPQNDIVNSFDSLNRLTRSSGPWGTFDYSYDEKNSIKSVELDGIVRSYEYGYEVPNSNGTYFPHRLERVTGGDSTSLFYNSNGSVSEISTTRGTDREKHLFEYNWMKRPIEHRHVETALFLNFDQTTLETVQYSEEETYRYDGNGYRVEVGDGRRTMYDSQGRLVFEEDLDERRSYEHIFVGQLGIATVVEDCEGASASSPHCVSTTRPPKVLLLTSEEKYRVDHRGSVEIEGLALDDVDGDVSDQIQWFLDYGDIIGVGLSSRPTENIGTGRQLSAQGLPLGEHRIEARVLTAKAGIRLEVFPGPNVAPRLVTQSSTISVYPGQFLSLGPLSAHFVDDDGDPLTFEVLEAPPWLNHSGNQLSGTVVSGPAAAYLVRVRAHDRLTSSPELIFTLQAAPGIEGDDQPNVLTGTALAESIIGNRGDDVIDGRGGSDHLLGGHGDDTIHGGDGDDFIDADGSEFGHDIVHGGPGSDVILGGRGDDELYGDGDDDIIDGGRGDDHIVGGPGSDTLVWDDGDDTVVGGDGDDLLDGGNHDNRMEGGLGDDVYVVSLVRSWSNDDEILEAGGVDEIRIVGATPDETVLRRVFGDDLTIGRATEVRALVRNHFRNPAEAVESITFSDGTTWDDAEIQLRLLLGTERADTIDGGAGDDVIDGLGGDDELDGKGGNDSLRGGDGQDHLWGGDGNDLLFGESGDDELWGGDGDDQLDGGPGGDRLRGYRGANVYLFRRLEGPDRLEPFEGTDTLRMLDLDPADVKVRMRESDFVVFDGAGVELLRVPYFHERTGTIVLDEIEFQNGTTWNPTDMKRESIRGTSSDDELQGWDEDDVIEGFGGDDLLMGHCGQDVLRGGTGNDRLISGRSSSACSIACSTDMEGGLGDDRMEGGGDATTYRFSIGDGSDLIVEPMVPISPPYASNPPAVTAVDRLVLGAGITQAMLSATRSGDDLILTIGSAGDQILFEDWYMTQVTLWGQTLLLAPRKVEEIEVDGVTLTAQDLEGLVSP